VTDLPVAATVVLVRDAPAGPEVLLIERPDRGSFAGAWVFPGGKVEDADALGMPHGTTEREVARVAGVRETREETGLAVDADRMVTLSCWTPPLEAPVRIRTWFFVAPDPGGDVSLFAAEAVAAQWVRPSAALASHALGELALFPPTWVTLHGLTDHGDAGALMTAVRLIGPRTYETRVRANASGRALLWQGDGQYDEEGAVDASARHRLDMGALPWTYVRTV
jgi:8-oxo-dGTP pyrophosphatase MutT (NUDIX family)